jgi:hypothetical protein
VRRIYCLPVARAVALRFVGLWRCGPDQPRPYDQPHHDRHRDWDGDAGRQAGDAIAGPAHGHGLFPDVCAPRCSRCTATSLRTAAQGRPHRRAGGADGAERIVGEAGWFSSDTVGLLNTVEVEDGVATADDATGLRTPVPGAWSSCGLSSLLAMLDTTLLQFPEIVETRCSLVGEVAAFCEWRQLVRRRALAASGGGQTFVLTTSERR